MEIKKRNKFMEFLKNYGVILASGTLIVIIAITLLIVGLSPEVTETQNQPVDDNSSISKPEDEPVSTTPIEYALPMKNASVIKDYSITELQYNQTLNRWEAHLAVDLMAESSDVMAIYDGKVTSIENDFLMGNIITIEHGDGLVSVYASLENVNVSVGDAIKTGQVIASASTSASSESADGAHLDFSMLLNGEEVDPNNYLALQNK